MHVLSNIHADCRVVYLRSQACCFRLPAFTLARKAATVSSDAYPLVNAVVVYPPAVVAVESVAVGVAPLAPACFALFLFAVLRRTLASLFLFADLLRGADLVFLCVGPVSYTHLRAHET